MIAILAAEERTLLCMPSSAILTAKRMMQKGADHSTPGPAEPA